ncbi:MAG: hypothetical protein HUK25_00110 [Treponema sp.]|nr:hypothetical protein [Treponema sp.]
MDGEPVKNDFSFSDYNEALYYEFPKKSVKSLYLDFSSACVVLTTGKVFSVETRGVKENGLICGLNEEGTLSIKNTSRIPNPAFFSHDRRFHSYPQILVTVPSGFHFDFISVKMRTGYLFTKKSSFSYSRGEFSCLLGKLNLQKLKGNRTSFRSVMSSFDMSGTFEGRNDLDCYFGVLRVKNHCSLDESSLDCKVAFAQLEFGDKISSFFGRERAEELKNNHYSVISALGSVHVSPDEV